MLHLLILLLLQEDFCLNGRPINMMRAETSDSALWRGELELQLQQTLTGEESAGCPGAPVLCVTHSLARGVLADSSRVTDSKSRRTTNQAQPNDFAKIQGVFRCRTAQAGYTNSRGQPQTTLQQ